MLTARKLGIFNWVTKRIKSLSVIVLLGSFILIVVSSVVYLGMNLEVYDTEYIPVAWVETLLYRVSCSLLSFVTCLSWCKDHGRRRRARVSDL